MNKRQYKKYLRCGSFKMRKSNMYVGCYNHKCMCHHKHLDCLCTHKKCRAGKASKPTAKNRNNIGKADVNFIYNSEYRANDFLNYLKNYHLCVDDLMY